MNSTWKILTAEEQSALQDIVSEAKEALAEAGFRVRTPRFPFSMHHDHYRARLRIDGKKPKHSEIASLLNAWAVERGEPSAYLWQAICGALKSIEPHGEKRVPEDIAASIDRAAQNCGFSEWLATRPEVKLYGAAVRSPRSA